MHLVHWPQHPERGERPRADGDRDHPSLEESASEPDLQNVAEVHAAEESSEGTVELHHKQEDDGTYGEHFSHVEKRAPHEGHCTTALGWYLSVHCFS